MSAAPEASVIIPVHNGGELLLMQLEALARQVNAPVFEVLVADNRSTEPFPTDLLERFPELTIRVVPAHDKQGANHARNCAAKQASGRHLLFCDADDIVSPDWVASLSKTLDDQSCLGTGPIEIKQLNDPEAAENYAPGKTEILPFPVQGYLPFAYGANCAMRREDYFRIGGFDETYIVGNQDVDFSWRAQEAGMPLVTVPEAVVHYRLRLNPRNMFWQQYKYQVTRVLLVERSRAAGRPVSGMSFKWSLLETFKGPIVYLKARKSNSGMIGWARRFGGALGSLVGHFKYRIFRNQPQPELIYF